MANVQDLRKGLRNNHQFFLEVVIVMGRESRRQQETNTAEVMEGYA